MERRISQINHRRQRNGCSFGTKLCDCGPSLAVQEATELFFARDLADKSRHRTCLLGSVRGDMGCEAFLELGLLSL
jgi:hypothetical protein